MESRSHSHSNSSSTRGVVSAQPADILQHAVVDVDGARGPDPGPAAVAAADAESMGGDALQDAGAAGGADEGSAKSSSGDTAGASGRPKRRTVRKRKDRAGGSSGEPGKGSEAAKARLQSRGPEARSGDVDGDVDGGAASATRPSSPAAAGGGCVMVVDDSRSNRVLLASVVRRCMPSAWKGCRVVQAADGQEALAAIESEMQEERPDGHPSGGSMRGGVRLVLLDFSMPRMSGPEMVRRLRADARASVRDIPVVGVTGNALPEDVAHFLHCGAERVLLKPVVSQDIRQAMEEVAARDATAE